MSPKKIRRAQRAALVVAVYARFSRNPDDRSESARTQVQRGTAEAKKRWPGCVVRVYCDDNYSGTTEDRPDYQRLLTAIRRGEIDIVLAKNQSRIARDTQIWDRFRIVCLAAGIEQLHSWTGGDISHVAGKSLPGRVMALFDAEYVEITRLNVLDNLALYASQGRAPGGFCCGYDRGVVAMTIADEPVRLKTLIPNEVLAPMLVTAFNEVLKGTPMLTMAEWFNDEHVPTMRGGELWRASNIRRLMRSATLTALRVHVTQETRIQLRQNGITSIGYKEAREYGNLYEGLWEPIIDRDVFLAAQDLFDKPNVVIKSNGKKATRGVKRGRPAKYLLSGLARCTRCEHTITGTKKKTRPAEYACHPSNGGCGRIGIYMDTADAEAERQFLEHLDDEDYRKGLLAGDPYAQERANLAAAIKKVDEKRKRNMRDDAEDKISEETYRERAATLDEQKAKLQAEFDALPEILDDVDPDAIIAAWAELSMADRRKVMLRLVERVDIHPARQMGGKGGTTLNPGRVVVHMKRRASPAPERTPA